MDIPSLKANSNAKMFNPQVEGDLKFNCLLFSNAEN